MKKRYRKSSYAVGVGVVFIIVSFLLLLLENYYDVNKGNGDGIILKWGVHSKLILFQFLSIGFTICVLFIRSSKKWLQNIGLSVVSSIVFLLVVDLFFGLLLLFKSEDVELSKLNYDNPNKHGSPVVATRYDEKLGYAPSKSDLWVESKVIKDKDTTIIYDVSYHYDSLRRRKIPSVSPEVSKSQFALFFGGSFTLGEGVEADETMAYNFTKHNRSYRPYNFGYSGYGPNQVLTILQDSLFEDQVKENDGVCIYTYVDAHISRVNGFLTSFADFGVNTPFYNFENGEIKYKGNFNEGRPIKSYLYFLLDNSNLLEYFRIEVPLKTTAYHLQLTARVIEECYLTYAEKFNNNRFYMVIFPGESDEIKHYIKNPNIKILNYTDLIDIIPYHIMHPYELHPNPEAYEIVVKEMIKEMEVD